MLTFNTDNMVAQEFPFPAPIMEYIFKNISAAQLLKLYKTCKFFYAKFRLNIIEDLEIWNMHSEQRIVGNSINICLDNPAWSKLNNLWISKSFTYCERFESVEPLQLDSTKFSTKFSCMTYLTLDIFGQLSVADFEFLVQPTTLRHLIINGTVCYPDTDVNLSVEEIIERAPHVSTFDLSREQVSHPFPPIDMKKLIALERQTKLTFLQVCEISKVPDVLLITEFLKKHATPNIDYFFGFDSDDADYDIVNVRRFNQAIDDGIQAWKTLEIPPIISTSFIDLTGKTAVVTGASQGIGRATVILFRQLGATVFAVSRNRGQLISLIDECQDIRNTGFLHTFWSPYIHHNFGDLFVRVNHKYDLKFDIMVIIADTFGWSGVPDTRLETKYCIDLHTNVKTHYRLLQGAKSYWKNSKGCIINVPYAEGLIARPEKASSSALRKNLIKNVEAELVSSGVRINTVNSSASVSTLPRPVGLNDIAYNKYLKELKKSHDQQAANSIAFLASDAAKSLNGSTLIVNPMNLR